MIAQQSLSQITALERTLGVFERDSRGTRLTDTGALFCPRRAAALPHTVRESSAAPRPPPV
jgi:hypothetical protein